MNVRSLLAVTLAALLVPAAALAAPLAKPAAQRSSAATPARSGLEGLSIGGFLGYETDDVDGLSLRVDGELPFRALSPQVNLSFVGSIGYSRLSHDVADIDFNIFKLIPAARFSFPINPQFTLFADGGLGLYRASFEEESTEFVGFNPVTFEPQFRTVKVSDSEISFLMRIGGGAFYHVNEKTRIGAMLELDPYFGDFDQTTFIFQAGAMFAL